MPSISLSVGTRRVTFIDAHPMIPTMPAGRDRFLRAAAGPGRASTHDTPDQVRRLVGHVGMALDHLFVGRALLGSRGEVHLYGVLQDVANPARPEPFRHSIR